MKLFTRPQTQLQHDDYIQEDFFDELSLAPDELSTEAKDILPLTAPEAVANENFASTGAALSVNGIPSVTGGMTVEAAVAPVQPVDDTEFIKPLNVHAKAIHGPRHILPATFEDVSNPEEEEFAPRSPANQPPSPELNTQTPPVSTQTMPTLGGEKILDLSSFRPAVTTGGMELPFSPHVIDLTS